MKELHKRAVAEGGKLSFYGTLAQVNAEKVLPVFETRFSGIKVDQIDFTADRLSARAVTEVRGGRTLLTFSNSTEGRDRLGLYLPINLNSYSL